MLHGVVTGTDGLHASVRHWGQRGALRNLIEVLLARGFEIVLTADHGNVEGRGIGKPNVGLTAKNEANAFTSSGTEISGLGSARIILARSSGQLLVCPRITSP
jgi:hypothetical protein